MFYDYNIILRKYIIEMITRIIIWTLQFEICESAFAFLQAMFTRKKSLEWGMNSFCWAPAKPWCQEGENSPARVFANASERNITVRDCRFIRQRTRTERRLTPINVSLSPGITSEGNEKPRGPSSAGKVFS